MSGLNPSEAAAWVLFSVALCAGGGPHLGTVVLAVVLSFLIQLCWWEPWGGYLMLLVYAGGLFVLLTYLASFSSSQTWGKGWFIPICLIVVMYLIVSVDMGSVSRWTISPGVDGMMVSLASSGGSVATILCGLTAGLLFLGLSPISLKAARPAV